MPEPIRSYRDLTVWQDSISLAAALYKLTSAYPKAEQYGPASQIRRAAASVPANIAEGHGREHTRSFIQSLRIAQDSLKELETHLFLSERVGHLSKDQLDSTINECESLGRRIRSLIRSLQGKVERED